MKKEVFLAIFAGVIAGLALAFGVWRLTSNFKKVQPTSNPESSPTPKTAFSIAVSKPSNKDVVTSAKTTVEGLTKAGSVVVVSTDTKDYKTTAKTDGSFEAEIDLTGGLNEVIITSFDEQGFSSVANLKIIYSSEFEKYSNTDSTNQDQQDQEDNDSTDSADTIRQKVQQKLDSTLKHATAYIGSITDIADSTVQINSDDEGIQQIMTSDETTFVSDEDLAIGDFIVAMGFKNGNDVLDAKRILTAKKEEKNENGAFWINIAEIAGKSVNGVNVGGEIIKLNFPKTWQGPNISELEVDQNIIVVGTLDQNTISLRSVFDIGE